MKFQTSYLLCVKWRTPKGRCLAGCLLVYMQVSSPKQLYDKIHWGTFNFGSDWIVLCKDRHKFLLNFIKHTQYRIFYFYKHIFYVQQFLRKLIKFSFSTENTITMYAEHMHLSTLAVQLRPSNSCFKTEALQWHNINTEESTNQI